MAILLLTSWITEPPPFSRKLYDIVEFFAGAARIARLAESRGWHSLAHDWDFDNGEKPGMHNSMDMCESGGFLSLGDCYIASMCTALLLILIICSALPHVRLAVMMVLCARRALICLGIECSTYVFMNAGTSRRSVLMPMGCSSRRTVAQANRFTSRPDSDVQWGCYMPQASQNFRSAPGPFKCQVRLCGQLGI